MNNFGCSCNDEIPVEDVGYPQCPVQDLYGQPVTLSEPNPNSLYSRSYQLSYGDVFRTIEETRQRESGYAPVAP